MTHLEVQNIAKLTLSYIKTKIKVGTSIIELKKLAENKMKELGATSFWYHNVGALIFSGEETLLSVSGKKYIPSQKNIETNDIITIDLSPSKNRIWGDFARTLIIEDGDIKENIGDIKNEEWKSSLIIENLLHEELVSFAHPDATFEDIYEHFNKMISSLGYINLDFSGNLGHSIAKFKNNRIYIEKGNGKKLSSVKYFTFEPHVSRKNGSYGYKKEDIYFFNGNILEKL